MLIQHNLAEDDCLDVQFIALRSAGEAPKAMIASAANRFIMMPDTRTVRCRTFSAGTLKLLAGRRLCLIPVDITRESLTGGI